MVVPLAGVSGCSVDCGGLRSAKFRVVVRKVEGGRRQERKHEGGLRLLLWCKCCAVPVPVLALDEGGEWTQASEERGMSAAKKDTGREEE